MPITLRLLGMGGSASTCFCPFFTMISSAWGLKRQWGLLHVAVARGCGLCGQARSPNLPSCQTTPLPRPQMQALIAWGSYAVQSCF
jgi:hypothetical protein